MEGIYTVLVADECDATRTFVADDLAADGYMTLAAGSREQPLVLVCERLAHVLVLDINGRTLALLDAVGGGHGVAGRLCPDVSILVLRGQPGELHRVRLPRRDADNPCSYRELPARIEMLLRRAFGPVRTTCDGCVTSRFGSADTAGPGVRRIGTGRAPLVTGSRVASSDVTGDRRPELGTLGEHLAAERLIRRGFESVERPT